jgi:hypothetical protein
VVGAGGCGSCSDFRSAGRHAPAASRGVGWILFVWSGLRPATCGWDRTALRRCAALRSSGGQKTISIGRIPHRGQFLYGGLMSAIRKSSALAPACRRPQTRGGKLSRKRRAIANWPAGSCSWIQLCVEPPRLMQSMFATFTRAAALGQPRLANPARGLRRWAPRASRVVHKPTGAPAQLLLAEEMCA